MAPTIVFPDAAALVCTALRTELGARGVGAHVGTVIPSPRPTQMVIARRVGGQRSTPVSDTADLSIECFAATDGDAQDLAQLARAIVHALARTVFDGVTVYRVDDLAGPDDLPDPLTDQSSYTLSLSITVRGAAAST